LQRADRQARDNAAAQHLRAPLDGVLERDDVFFESSGLPSLVDGWEFPIVDRAVSISGGYGFRFDEEERFNHLFQSGGRQRRLLSERNRGVPHYDGC
jgi:hypothetical protein